MFSMIDADFLYRENVLRPPTADHLTVPIPKLDMVFDTATSNTYDHLPLYRECMYLE